MEISFASISLITLSSTIFGAGGFYLLTQWRLTRLEEKTNQIPDLRERLVRIETILTNLKKE